MKPPASPNSRPRLTTAAVAAGLAAVTLVAYWRALQADFNFVSFDDHGYVYDNPEVYEGLTWSNIEWALGSAEYCNWHPITWLSLQLDAELFGTYAPAFHRVNVGFHVANTVLLFLVLFRMTGARGRSAVVALLFALHPLHVESVAWVSERKDVLSTFFWMLTLLAYSHYVAAPRVGRYLLVAFPFILGLMAKPMVVTLPCVLLLLDFWPLARLPGVRCPDQPAVNAAVPRASWSLLVWEKLPLFLMSFFSSEMTYYAQEDARTSFDAITVTRRVTNSIESYVGYITKTLWPVDLIPLYPYQQQAPPWWRVAVFSLLLLAVTGIAVWQARRRGYLLVGWLWYLGTLVPVIGLIQVGRQSMADRYTYIPLVGLFLAVVWLCADLRFLARRPLLRGLIVAAVAAACLWRTHDQLRHWRNSEALWSHAIELEPNYALFHYCLGQVYLGQGRLDEAIECLGRAASLDPSFRFAKDAAIEWKYMSTATPE